MRKSHIISGSDLWIDDLLSDVVEVVPAVIRPQPRVEGGCDPANLPGGSLDNE